MFGARAANAAAAMLLERKERVATVEATAGGIIGASLLACPGASRFFVSSCVVYSRHGYKQFLPHDVLKASGVWDQENNYSGRKQYVESKIKFVKVCAPLMQKYTRADWMIIESGTSGPEFYISGVNAGFTAIGIVGPGGFEHVELVETGSKDRVDNMRIFTEHALEAFEVALKRALPSCKASL